MNDDLEALERRAGSMHSIRGVVHTMKTLSAINAAPYAQSAHAINDYLDVVTMALQAMLQNERMLVTQSSSNNTQNTIILAFGTDHGLCGNYNQQLAHATYELLNSLGNDQGAAKACKGALPEHSDVEGSVTAAAGDYNSKANNHHIICVGSRLNDALANVGLASEKVLFSPSNTDALIRLAANIVTEIDKISAKDASASLCVKLVFTQSSEQGSFHNTVHSLLPIPEQQLSTLKSRTWPSTSIPWFRQNQVSLFPLVLRNYLFARVCQAATQAMLTENSARLSRMRQAEDTVNDQLESLSTKTRSARQSRITEELQDVISGFEAASKN